MEFYSQKSCNTGTAIHKPECPEIKQFIYQNMVKTAFHNNREKQDLKKKVYQVNSASGEQRVIGTRNNLLPEIIKNQTKCVKQWFQTLNTEQPKTVMTETGLAIEASLKLSQVYLERNYRTIVVGAPNVEFSHLLKLRRQSQEYREVTAARIPWTDYQRVEDYTEEELQKSARESPSGLQLSTLQYTRVKKLPHAEKPAN